MKISMITSLPRWAGKAEFSFPNGWTAAVTDDGRIATFPTAMDMSNCEQDYFSVKIVEDDFSIAQEIFAVAQRSRCKFLSWGI